MQIGINVSRYLELSDQNDWLGVLAGYSVIRWMNHLPVTIPTNISSSAWKPTTAQEIISNHTAAKGNWFAKNGYPSPDWIIETSNRLNAKAWISLPLSLSVSEMAKLVLYFDKRLKHGLIVEVGNEAFNAGFSVFHEYGSALAAMTATANLTIDLAKSIKWLTNVEIVFGGWAGNVWHSKQVLQNTDLSAYIDALAIAPYFSMQCKTILGAALDVDGSIARVNEHVKLSKKHGIKLYCYEMGQHAEGDKSAEMNRSKEMADIYADYAKKLNVAGVELGCWYSSCTSFGKRSFGLYEVVNGKPVVTPKAIMALSLAKGEIA